MKKNKKGFIKSFSLIFKQSFFKKIIILELIFLLINGIPVLSETITVSNNETNVSSIQNAINTASSGDTIFLEKGNYSENIWINKSITLKGETKGNVNLNGSGKNAIVINEDNVTLYNITIIQALNGIIVQSSNCTLFNNTFIENSVALQISNNSDNNLFYNNNFIDNENHTIDYSNQTKWHKGINGNYWDDYNGVDTNNDGIGETAYSIPTNATDPFPSITPISMQPITDFTIQPENLTTQTVISFNDESTDIDGNIVTWNWSFGDGSTSTITNPTHQYTDDGTYTVKLTVTDNFGINKTKIKSIIIKNVKPNALFTFHPKVPLDIQEVDFRDNSTDVDGNIVNRTWFINGIFFNQTSMLRYTFPDNGTYTATLKVTDDDGDSSTYSQQIQVLNVAPSAGFTYSTQNNNYTKNNPISFTDTSSDVDGSIVSYHWDFGDGTTSTERHPSHTFSSNGRYKITLSIEDNDGKTDSYGKQLQIGSTENPDNFLTELSMFDIIIVIIIFSVALSVVIISKKYS